MIILGSRMSKKTNHKNTGSRMSKKQTTKTPTMFNLHLYFKQGSDLNEYLEAHEKDAPAAVLAWLNDLESKAKSLKKLIKQLDKKKIKCIADTNDISFITSDSKTIALLDDHALLIEDRITVDLAYNDSNIDLKLDEKLDTLAQAYGGSKTDAGYFFGEDGQSGQRDMTFEFEAQEDADAFELAAVKVIPKKKRVS